MNSKFVRFSVRNRILFLVDWAIIAISYLAIMLMIKDLGGVVQFYSENLLLVLLTAVVFTGTYYFGRVYRTMWTYAGFNDYLRISFLSAFFFLFVILIGYIFRNSFTIYLKHVLVVLVIISAFTLLSRMALRAYARVCNVGIGGKNHDGTKVLIIGAGSAGRMLIREIETNKKLDYQIVGVIDDDKAKRNLIINGCRVLGDTKDIKNIVDSYGVKQIIFAIPSASSQRRKEILSICSDTGCHVKVLPDIGELVHNVAALKQVKRIQIEDLLGRETVKLDNEGISECISGKVILVTGGGGSIGSELCRQIMKYSPKKLVILDIYENNAYDIQMELNANYPNNKPDVVIASVRDAKRLAEVFSKYKPYMVFHAAAHKHVPLMEDNPGEAIKNNVFGTYNAARCADKAGVSKFILISTDKAVNPTNVMGATKRLCEMIIQSMQTVSKTEFAAVRFGNVLGSNGSVIPLFKRQIENGGPITLTHKEITRFFMTIPEAAQLVLQAANYAKGGEIFVLDMGEPVKIYDLAVNMIKLSGLKPDEDIEIKVTGLRPGEKLYEELLMNEEGLTNTAHEKIFIGKPVFEDISIIESDLKKLSAAVENGDQDLIKNTVAEVVPTYKRKKIDKERTIA